MLKSYFLNFVDSIDDSYIFSTKINFNVIHRNRIFINHVCRALFFSFNIKHYSVFLSASSCDDHIFIKRKFSSTTITNFLLATTTQYLSIMTIIANIIRDAFANSLDFEVFHIMCDRCHMNFLIKIEKHHYNQTITINDRLRILIVVLFVLDDLVRFYNNKISNARKYLKALNVERTIFATNATILHHCFILWRIEIDVFDALKLWVKEYEMIKENETKKRTKRREERNVELTKVDDNNDDERM